MKKAIIYQKEECVIIKTIDIAGNRFAFFVAVNSKKIIYLKESIVHDRVTYVSLEKLVHLFPKYQCASIFNTKVILDTFINTINYKIRTGAIVDSDEILEIIYQFEKITEDPYIKQMTDASAHLIFNKQAMFEVTNTIKKLDGKYKKVNLSDLLRTSDEKGNDVFLSQNWLDGTNNKEIVYESIRRSNERHRRSPIDFLFNNRVLNVYMVIIIVSVVGFISCLGMLQEWHRTGEETQEEIDDIMEEALIDPEAAEEAASEEVVAETPAEKQTYTVPSDTSKPTVTKQKKYGNDYWDYMEVAMANVNFSKLKATNNETVAWLFVNNTNINYPVVQHRDNSYYLNRSFNKKTNKAGWIFADYRSNFTTFKRNTVIYGHGRIDQVMFGSMSKILQKSWYTNKNNQIVKLATPKANTQWRIVSIYVVPAEAYYLSHNFENDAAYQKWINKMVSRSIYNFGTSVSTKDKFLTLSTCKDNKGNRIVLQAKLIKNEKR